MDDCRTARARLAASPFGFMRQLTTGTLRVRVPGGGTDAVSRAEPLGADPVNGAVGNPRCDRPIRRRGLVSIVAPWAPRGTAGQQGQRRTVARGAPVAGPHLG